MSTPYTGVATPPPQQDNPPPIPGGAPAIVIPADSDANNVATMFLQQYRAIADHLAYLMQAGNPLVPRTPNLVNAGFSAVSHVGTGGGTVTPTAGPSNGAFYIVVLITVGGAVGTAKFKFSTDGGTNFGAEQISAATYLDGSGVEIALAGTFVADDTYSFWPLMTPLAQWKDASGNGRLLIDHNGFPGGRLSRIYSEWQTEQGVAGITGTPTVGTLTAMPTWNYYVLGAGGNLAGYLPGPANDVIFPSALMRTIWGDDNGSTIGMSNVNSTLFMDDMVIEWEQELAIDTVGANKVTVSLGIGDGLSNAPASGSYAYFRKASTDTNWQCVSALSSVETSVDSGVVPVAGEIQRFRIELHGATTPFGACALFFINETLVAVVTTNLPTDRAIGMGFCVVTTTASPTGRSYAGPPRMDWNRFGDVPAL